MQSNYWSISQIPGLNPEEQANLQACGINDTRELLEKAQTLQARESLAEQLKIKLQCVNKWVALADLARIPSVSCQYCGLLLHSGVISVAQLIQTPVYRLHRQILRLQVKTFNCQDLSLSIELVHRWVREARLIS